MKQHNFIEDNIIILSKQTLDEMLKDDYPSDLIGLYCFYYYTAKWQKTSIIKCSTGYVSKGLKWTKDRVIKNKKKLKDIGLIEDETTKNKEGKITGWYIKVKYIWKKETIKNQRVAEPEGGSNQRVANPDTNALSVNSLNALSDSNIAEQSSAEGIPSKEKEAEGGTPPKEPPKYDFKDSLAKMEKDSRRHINIIALYWKFKGIAPENKQQYEALLKRELRPAQNLVGFSDDRILEVMDFLEGKNDFKWGIETILKFITEDLDSIAPIKAKKYRY